MGGKKGVGGAVGGFAKDMSKGLTLGTYNADTGAWNMDPLKAGERFVQGMSLSDTRDSLMPGAPKLPKPEDTAEQARRAQAEAEAKIKGEIGERGRGLSSTILGGSVGTDNSVLKKRKLLGE